MAYRYAAYAIVVLSLLILILLGLIYLTLLTHRNIHTRNDPARTAFPHFRSTLHLFLFSTLLNVITVALLLSASPQYSNSYDSSDSFDSSSVDRILASVNHLAITSSFLHSLASCTLILTTAHLASGLRRAASGGSYTPPRVLLTINIIAGLAALFWTAFFIERQVDLSHPYHSLGIASFIFAILALVGFGLLLIGAITVLVYVYKVRSALRKLPAGGEYMGVAKRMIALAWVMVVLYAWMIVSGIIGGLTMSSYVGFWVII